MLMQVLMNLCLNAREAMPEGGRRLTEAVNLSGSGPAPHPQLAPGDCVRLRVRDTGLGMDDATVARIFEPFFTTKEVGKGTGLGLATVYGIVRQHQGAIECASEVGRGTTFTIYLPRAAAESSAVEAPTPARPAVRAPAGATVLLADDEPMIRQLGRTVLEQNGYRVILAEDGLETVE